MSHRKQFTLQELILITIIAAVMAAILIPKFFRDTRERVIIERMSDTRK